MCAHLANLRNIAANRPNHRNLNDRAAGPMEHLQQRVALKTAPSPWRREGRAARALVAARVLRAPDGLERCAGMRLHTRLRTTLRPRLLPLQKTYFALLAALELEPSHITVPLHA